MWPWRAWLGEVDVAAPIECTTQQIAVTGLEPVYEEYDPLNTAYVASNDGRGFLYIATDGQVTISLTPQISTGITGVSLNNKVIVTQAAIYIGPLRTDWYNNDDGQIEFSAEGDGEIIPNIAWLRL